MENKTQFEVANDFNAKYVLREQFCIEQQVSRQYLDLVLKDMEVASKIKLAPRCTIFLREHSDTNALIKRLSRKIEYTKNTCDK